jgi:phenylalanyl-tRNA synthetase alpha chain
MDIMQLVEGLHPLERKVIPFLDKVKTLSELVEKSKLQEVEAMRALQWLENKGAVKIVSTENEFVELDVNGVAYSKKGLPEKQLLQLIRQKPSSFEEIQKTLSKEEFGIAIGLLKQKSAINVIGNSISITNHGKELLGKSSLEEQLIMKLKQGSAEVGKLEAEERSAFDNLMRRKQIVQKKTTKIKFIELTQLGKQLTKQKIEHSELVEAVTPELLLTKQWKGKKFRPYDVTINVPAISSGKRHFMAQTIDYIKKIWLEMGFEEMTGQYVETSFWDLDSLFVPQDHPARTMQDTFYLADEKGKILLGKLPSDHKKVKEVHEYGGTTGSKGWQNPWDEKLAKEVLLRTHCTALSAHTISKLTKKDLPRKYFAVSRVFRNETMDWKHLFEFEQVEGIVISEDVSFRHLLGYLKQFFAKMGFTDVRLRPAHFPYTEPSVEVEVYNPVKKQWVELGGAGIFRPEVTKTLLGVEVPVLAWGLGLARIAAEYWDIQDIRETYKNDLKYLRNLKLFMR